MDEAQPNSPSGQAESRPSSESSTDHAPINGLSDLIESLLRNPRRLVAQCQQRQRSRLVVSLLAVAIILVAAYGIVVGSFSGGVQWWAAPAKIAIGMIATAAICLPSLYIFACLSGSPARLDEVLGALGGTLALTTLLLIGFAPVAWLFSQSTESAVTMGFFHVLFWLVAVRFGVRFLLVAFRHFGLKSEAGLKTWVVIFLLVSLQMTTALRPLLGTADTWLPHSKKFFVAHWIECLNAPRP